MKLCCATSYPLRIFSNQFIRSLATVKTGRALLAVEKAVFPEGYSNYLLISVYIHGESLLARTIVRGHTDSHTSLYDKIKKEMSKKELCIKTLGGGKINMDGKTRRIKIYSECKTFGRADHYQTKDLLKATDKFNNYRIHVK